MTNKLTLNLNDRQTFNWKLLLSFFGSLVVLFSILDQNAILQTKITQDRIWRSSPKTIKKYGTIVFSDYFHILGKLTSFVICEGEDIGNALRIAIPIWNETHALHCQHLQLWNHEGADGRGLLTSVHHHPFQSLELASQWFQRVIEAGRCSTSMTQTIVSSVSWAWSSLYKLFLYTDCVQ